MTTASGLRAAGNFNPAEHAGLQGRMLAGTEGIPRPGHLHHQGDGARSAVQTGLPAHHRAAPVVAPRAALPVHRGDGEGGGRCSAGTRRGQEAVRGQGRQPAEFIHRHRDGDFHRAGAVQSGDLAPGGHVLAEVEAGLDELAVSRGQQAGLRQAQLGLFQLGARHRDGGFGLLHARAVQSQQVFGVLHGAQRLVAPLLRTVALARRNGALARQLVVAPQVRLGDGEVLLRQRQRLVMVLALLVQHRDFLLVLHQARADARPRPAGRGGGPPGTAGRRA